FDDPSRKISLPLVGTALFSLPLVGRAGRGSRLPLGRNDARSPGALMDTTAWIELVIIVVALVVAALAASAETSMTSISRVRLKRLVEEKNPRAMLVERLQRDPNGYLSTILIANTVAIITATSAATLLSINLFGEHVAQWLVGLVLALVVLMFCEISPKTLALQRSERVALAL